MMDLLSRVYTLNWVSTIRGEVQASWRYAEIPHALGCDGWFSARVTTCGEFDQALTAAGQGDRAAYIEVVTDTYAASPLSQRLHENVKTLYQS
jgi:indolepyruvate decarboxylase